MLSKRVTGICLLISGVTLLASVNARAQTLASAKILSSDGPVEIQRRPQGEAALTKISYSVNDELLAGDVIRTFKGGRLVLGLTDGSQAIIGERTTVEITDLSKSPRTIFNVLSGKTRIKIEKAGGRPNPYRVNTPTAVIAVRGTLFDVFVKGGETQVFVHEGEVAVSNRATPEALVILSPGETTRVQQARPPEPPSRFQPGRNNDTFNPRPTNAPGGGFGGARAGDRGVNGPERGASGSSSGQPGNAPSQGAPPNGASAPVGQKGGDRRPPE